MSDKKVYPELTLFDGGLNLSTNPLMKQPNEWADCQNAFVGKPYGFKTTNAEQEHVAQSRPPMRLFNTTDFDFSVAAVATEVKPLVGANQAAADNEPSQWQTIALGIPGEGWQASFSGTSHLGPPTVSTQTPGLTLSDGNNETLACLTPDVPNSAGVMKLSNTFAKPPFQGQIGNNNTAIYIDYRYLYKLAYVTGGPYDPFVSNSPYYPLTNMVLKIGTDPANYIYFNLPTGTAGSPPAQTQVFVDASGTLTTTYGINRFTTSLRTFSGLVGTKSFGELMANPVFVSVEASVNQTTNLGLPMSDPLHEFFDFDHPRLDVDYLGFFGDFTVGNPFQQITLCSLDPVSPQTDQVYVFSGGAYPERRLSIGAGSCAVETNRAATTASVVVTPTPAMATPLFVNPMALLLDVYKELFSAGSTAQIVIAAGVATATYDFTAALNSFGEGDAILKIQAAGGDALFSLADITSITLNVFNGTSAGCKLYFSNLRLAPNYTIGTGFAPQSGNIRDSFLYDPITPGQTSRFVLSCGDTLFLGNNFLGPQSWFLDGGFSNWTQANPGLGLQKRFVFGIAPNPDFVFATQLTGGSSTLTANAAQGQTSIQLASVVGLVAGMTIQVGSFAGGAPQYLDVDSTYTGGLTVPLSSPIVDAQNSGTAVSWGANLTGSTTIFVSSTLNLTPGEQVVIDAGGVNPEINYVASSYAGGSTIPLQNELQFDHTSGASVTWENFAEPESIGLFVNGSDGYYSFKLITYPLSGGSTYQYPSISKIVAEAYSTLCDHQGYIALAGDPNNPERIVFASPSDATVIPAQSFEELPVEGNANAGDAITALKSFEQFLIVSRRSDVAVMYGDSINNFDLRFTSATRGALSQNHVAQAGRRIFFFSHDGVYEFSNFTTVRVTDKIHQFFQYDDYNRSLSGFLFFNPLREVLVVVVPRDYDTDPETLAICDIYTLSLQKQAWGWFHNETLVDARNTVFSAVFYGGGGGTPAVFFSSTTMVEWDSGPDGIIDTFKIQMAFNHFGNPHQQKVYDKLYVYAQGFQSNTGVAAAVYVNIGQLAQTNVLLATNQQIAVDADGMVELFCPSGTWGKFLSPFFLLLFDDWVDPVQMQSYGVSYFPGEEL